MTTFVLATESVHDSAALCDYLDGRLAEGDRVEAVAATAEDGGAARDGADALNAVRARLAGVAAVGTRRFAGEDPATAVLEHARDVGAAEVVLAVDGEEPGPVARELLARSRRPLAVVPRRESE